MTHHAGTITWHRPFDACYPSLKFCWEDLVMRPAETEVEPGAAVWRFTAGPIARARLRHHGNGIDSTFDWESAPDATAEDVNQTVDRIQSAMERPTMALADTTRLSISPTDQDAKTETASAPRHKEPTITIEDVEKVYWELSAEIDKHPSYEVIGLRLAVSYKTIGRCVRRAKGKGRPYPPPQGGAS